ncbi:MAG: SsrA-binding protein [Gammaproteobacteria bacterium 39-13]|jgi:SsrA-binding protein|nr:SsrA-binding protein SmpB [Gammaproteobacteria bacterium]OJV91382.1 MAG: SsrA-binding protein [Gammaproteobacteria bacterium 39-13]
MSKKQKTDDLDIIAENRKARFEYTIEERFEAGIVLQGWEVKSLRAGKGGIADSYVIIKNGEAWLLNAQIIPLNSASTHIHPENSRTRKLLLNKKELKRLIGAVERKGYTLIPLKMYWKNGLAKVSIAIAQGKKLFDKRETEKARDWQRDRQRILKR